MPGVVEELVLGRAPVDVIVLFCPAIESSRVATRTQLPVERQLEVSELVLRHEVADRPLLGQDAICDLPARGHSLLLVASPRRGACPIEERTPPAGALLGGQRRGSRSGTATRGRRTVPHWRAGEGEQRQLRDDRRARGSSMHHGFLWMNYSDCPTGAILSRQVLIRISDVGDTHVLAVVQDLSPLPRAQRDDPEQHRLGELCSVLEWRAGLGLALDRLHPV